MTFRHSWKRSDAMQQKLYNVTRNNTTFFLYLNIGRLYVVRSQQSQNKWKISNNKKNEIKSANVRLSKEADTLEVCSGMRLLARAAPSSR